MSGIARPSPPGQNGSGGSRLRRATRRVQHGHADTDTAEAMGLDFFASGDDPWTQTGALARELGLDACAGT